MREEDIAAAIIARATDLLQAQADILVATVFGSFAHDHMTATSDLDLAVAAERPLSLEQLVELRATLSEATGREVDVVDLQRVTGTILQQALCAGKMLLVKDKRVYAELLKKLWYDEADMMPLYRMILKHRRDKFI